MYQQKKWVTYSYPITSKGNNNCLCSHNLPRLQEKNIVELNAIDLYDFEDEGYKCTVNATYIADNDGQRWYMRMQEKKMEPQLGGGYRCPKCLATFTWPVINVYSETSWTTNLITYQRYMPCKGCKKKSWNHSLVVDTNVQNALPHSLGLGPYINLYCQG